MCCPYFLPKWVWSCSRARALWSSKSAMPHRALEAPFNWSHPGVPTLTKNHNFIFNFLFRFPRALQQCFSSLFENDDFTAEEANFYALVAILTLYISTVNDQNEQLYGSLCTKLTESQQVKLQQIFEHILTNRKTMTKESLSCLLITSSSNASTPGIYFSHLLANAKL